MNAQKNLNLEKWMCDVLDIKFKFILPKRSEREKKELKAAQRR